jgi:hypothetical protein
VISLLLATVAAVAMSATGVVLATSPAGAAGSAPTITNGIAAFTVGENAPTPSTFDVDTVVQGGVANIDPTSLTIVTPAPAGDATSTVTSSSSHGFITTTFAVDGSGNTLATGPFGLTFGACSPGTATYSATNSACSTGTLTYDPSSNQNMGDELKILGIVTEDIYEGIGIASVEPATVPQGGTFTLTNAAVATALPASDDGFTVNYADEFAAIVPVPAGLTYVPGSVALEGGDSTTAGEATAKYCTAAATGCDATINTGNYKTNYPYIEEELPSSIEVPGGENVSMPTVTARFTATGSVGTVEPVDLTEFKLNTNVSTAGNVTFDGYPTNSSNGSGTPPYTPPTPLSTTTIAPASTAPSITSSNSATFTEGHSGSFTVTTSGNPTPSLSESGPLPGGVTFTDNGNGTGTLAGTPTVGSNGTYPITIGASNGTSPNASQSFTLHVTSAPAITSAASTTFVQGSDGTFTVTSTGNPTAALSESGTLPSGVSFVNNGNGTGTLSGTPAPGTGGTYPVTLTASNGVSPAANQSFTVTVDAPPTITSSDSATFTEGAAGSFTVTTSGNPTASLSETGDLPGGVTFTDNGNGTGTLAGTPTVGSNGTYPITIGASNGVSPNANQSFTLQVSSAPAITSTASTTFVQGSDGTFTVTSTGNPTAALSESGTLPSGVSFVDNGDGTGTLSGTPAPGTGGTYPVTLTASNGVSPAANESFTLTVDASPTITSSGSTDFAELAHSSFTVTTTGNPTASLSESGDLPSGVSFTDNGNGTASLAGTPDPGTAGTYPITITATNGVSPDATQSFTLHVASTAFAPSITSGDNTTFQLGSAGSFTVSTFSEPTASISESGSLPSGVTLTDNGDGTATLAGIPTAQGTYPLTITATNGVSPDASQSFTLTVEAAPVVTSAAGTTFITGTNGSFTVTSTGTPTASLSESGTLPNGVSFVDNGNGTGTLSGTPAAGSGGSYPITFGAGNGVGSPASQSFTLTVHQAPAITSANGTTFTTSGAGSFMLVSTGTPTASLSESGALPNGVSFVDNGDGTGTLSGTPAAGSGGSYPITFGAGNGVGSPASQSFTLTVDQPPVITSAGSATFLVGSDGSFTPTATGFPTPTITESGPLPGGVSFTHGSLSGTPTGTGSFPITFTASSSGSSPATQSFTLTVNQAPSITSANATTFAQSAAGTFTVTAAGTPTPSVAEFGNLPSGITFTPHANGTGTLAGTSSEKGTFDIGFIASNGQGGNATQFFTLTLSGLQITTTSLPQLTEGTPYSVQLTSSGGIAPLRWSKTATLPRGLTFSKTGVLAGTVSAYHVTRGTYTISVKVTDATKKTHQTVTKSFQLKINS